MSNSANTTEDLLSAPAPASSGQRADREIGVRSRAEPKRALKVCIIGLKCFDQIAANPTLRYLGGIETQLALLAKGLRQEGYEVSLITYDHGQPDEAVFEGVKVLKSYSPTGGIRRWRWFSRVARLWRAMWRADADIYLQMGAGDETGMVALGCKLKPKRPGRFVFCLAHDVDCYGIIGAGRFAFQTLVYLFGIRRAQMVISQTETQRRNLEKSLGLKSRIIHMAAAATEGSCGGKSCANDVLWVGRIVPDKRFEWLLEVARRCPEITFHVAGAANGDTEYSAKMLSEVAGLPNVRMHGSLPRAELNKLFHRCCLLCCTSVAEGFPTTFLEVWSCGMPIVTTFDPDGAIARHGLGAVATTLDELTALLRSLPKSDAYSQMSDAARKYYLENQTVEAVSRRFRLAFEELAAS
jgi:glycosyltransferase involved in cell wall biosynthesis